MRLLEHHCDEDRDVRVIEVVRDGSRRYYDSGVLYTAIDASGRNTLEYVNAMLARLPRKGRILMLGVAGGALASELSRTGAEVTAVDIWADAFTIARRWFYLPENVTCVHADAADFMRDTCLQWPAIAIDVFEHLSIPSSMFTTAIAARLQHVLEPAGHVIWNVAAGVHEEQTCQVIRLMKQAGLKATAYPVFADETLANTIVVGVKAQDPTWRSTAGEAA